MKVLIVIPTYNERENIKPLIIEIFKEFKKNKLNGRILVVDDNSPDGTGAEVKKIIKSNKNVFLLERKKKEGLGVAYIAGFKRAFELKPDLIFEMDADFSHNPKYIVNFVNKIEKGYDVVIGARYGMGGGCKDWPFHRRLTSLSANLLIKLILNLPVIDVTTGFRAYKTKVLKSINFNKIKSKGYEFQPEMLFKVNRLGFKIGQVPIIFESRKLGKSKLSSKEIVNFLHRAFQLRIYSILGEKQ